MKKDSFNLPFKSNFFKEQDPFHLVIVFFIIFFGTAIFFSIPTFYDYKKYNQKIEETINNEFKIKIHNLEGISFRFIPSPHLLIKKADLKIKENEKNPLSEITNLKMFISILDLYKHDKFKIKRVHIDKANIYFNELSLNNFIQNLKSNIVNNLIIRKSTLFFKNKEDKIILISTVKNLNYRIDFKNNKKILNIIGNIFDSNYEYKYVIDYQDPNLQQATLELKNPNLLIENKIRDNHSSSSHTQEGVMDIQFLNQKNTIKYDIKNSNIFFKNKGLNNSNFDIDGAVNFKPFHFDLLINIKKVDLTNIENLIYKIYLNKKLKYENLSGSTIINFNNIDNKIMNKGFIKLKFEGSKLSPVSETFYLKDFAILEISDYEYLENIDQILQMKIKVNIINNDKFNRFLFNYKKNKITDENIYFIYQYNANSGNSFISKISNKGFGNNTEFYKFKNLQQLKNLLKDDNVFNLD